MATPVAFLQTEALPAILAEGANKLFFSPANPN